MNTILKLLFTDLTSPEGDLRFARRGSQLAAVIVFGIMAWGAWRQSTNAFEMIVAMVLGALTAALLVAMAHLMGLVARRLKTGPAPTRWPEYAGYALTIATLASGLFFLSMASLDRIGFLIWMLALLATSLTLICLSNLTTLLRFRSGLPS